MTDKKIIEQIHRMIDRGRQQGFITYGEIAALLPPDALSHNRLDDVVTRLEDLNIEVVEDGASLPDRADALDEAPHEDPADEKAGFEDAPGDQQYDPMGRYLHELS